jgi:hypothetical protein
VVEGQLPPGPGWLEGPRPPPPFPPEDPAEPEEEPDFGIENTSYQELYHGEKTFFINPDNNPIKNLRRLIWYTTADTLLLFSSALESEVSRAETC